MNMVDSLVGLFIYSYKYEWIGKVLLLMRLLFMFGPHSYLCSNAKSNYLLLNLVSFCLIIVQLILIGCGLPH